MALKISIPNSVFGVSFNDAYARITFIFANKNSCEYKVSVSANEEARQANAQDVASYEFFCATPTDNIMVSLYNDLKTRSGFENAIDC